MEMPLSILMDNLSEVIHNNKCVDCESNLDHIKTKNEKLIFKRFNCKQYYIISEDLSIIEMNKTKVKMNKPIYVGLSLLDISKILMYECWYDYMKPKYNDKVKLCYMDTDSFVMNIKTNDFHKDIANDVEKRFDTSNYEVNRPFPTGEN